MAEYIIEDDKERDLRIMTVRGTLSFNVLLARVLGNFQCDRPPLNLLWDLREADAAELAVEDLRELARRVKPLSDARAGGRTALVCSGDLEFGIMRMVETFGEIEEVPISAAVFRTREDAERWLFE